VNGIVLTHGAGSNRNAPLLIAMDREFTALGWIVERVDLAFRESGRSGPPRPADQHTDREGLAVHLRAMRGRVDGKVLFGGHSYGGRQGSMLLAAQPKLADALLLLGYPLHPPAKPAQLRTEHFPNLHVPALFASGGKDEFGTPEELKAAVSLIPARTQILTFDKLKHDLGGGKGATPAEVAQAFAAFVL